MTKKSPLRLSQEQVIKLGAWLTAHKVGLEAIPESTKKIARNASTDLGFPIAGNSITRIAKHVGITLALPTSTVSVRHTLNRKRIDALREGLLDICTAAGIPVPACLEANWPKDSV